MCFPVNFGKFSRTPFLIEHPRWLTPQWHLSEYFCEDVLSEDLPNFFDFGNLLNHSLTIFTGDQECN